MFVLGQIARRERDGFGRRRSAPNFPQLSPRQRQGVPHFPEEAVLDDRVPALIAVDDAIDRLAQMRPCDRCNNSFQGTENEPLVNACVEELVHK